MNLLIICSQGQNRSKYLAGYLREKGYNTDYGGVAFNVFNPLKQEQINWTDSIIVVKPHIKYKLNSNFNIKNKNIITLNVSDNPEDYPEEAQKKAFLYPYEFQKEYVYKELREQIKPYLKKLTKYKSNL